jgi:Cu+-exporting ATPase
MALEPLDPSDDPGTELTSMTRRFLVSAVLTLPLLVLSMAPHLTSLHLEGALAGWPELALATPVVWVLGWPLLARGFTSLRTSKPSMFTLIMLGTLVSWGVSTAALLLPGTFASWSPSGEVRYFEPAAVIVTLTFLGQVLELRARARARADLRSLLDLRPPTARVLTPGGDRDVPVAELEVGDVLRLREGGAVPADATLTSGTALLDESSLTGEPVPVEKSVGDRVWAGTVVTSGTALARADAVGASTSLAAVVEAVSAASRVRVPAEVLVEKVSRVFVPLVAVLSALTAAAWLILSGDAPSAFLAAVSVLVVACPCALGLATPMAVTASLARGARAGVLARDPSVLGLLEHADVVVFDKTGTLTAGAPELSEVTLLPGVSRSASTDLSEDAAVRLAASLERTSTHPYARALLRAAAERSLELFEPEDVTTTPGRGLSGRVGGRRVLVGNAEHLRASGVVLPPDLPPGVLVAADGRLGAAMGFSDPLHPDAARVVSELKGAGLEVVVLTGDAPGPAREVARSLGVERVHAGKTPQEKGEVIDDLKASGRVVVMAGDGTNDALALAHADVGVALGAATDVALLSAPLAVLRSGPAGVLSAMRLGRATTRAVHSNLVLAFAYNVLAIPLAAGALYPATGVLLSPSWAALAMALSSVSVVLNALRLRARPL